MDPTTHYRPLMERIVSGRPVVFVGGMLAGYRAEMLESLLEAGAERILLVATGEGTGDPPPAELADRLVIPVRGSSIMDEFRVIERMLTHPPPPLVEALERFDPNGEARVLGSFFTPVDELCGREVYGGRPPRFAVLEDKATVDELWAAAGIDVAPAEVVCAEAPDLVAAHGRLDRGGGTVWALDASRGWHGGADGTRWITAPLLDPAVEWATSRAERVRVMPYLEGVPCSIHGIVFPAHVAVFRPCELLTLRRRDTRLFFYGGSATVWDPLPQHRDAMREVAGRVGRTLAERHGYRGGFTVDGVMTSEGFRPTELNAPVGVGLRGGGTGGR